MRKITQLKIKRGSTIVRTLLFSIGIMLSFNILAKGKEPKEDLATAVNKNTADIATNASDIGTNAADIGTNAADIGTNATNISTNATNIGTHATNMSANASAINTNASSILTNVGAIGTNATNIGTNTSDIDTNADAIVTNAGAIGTNAGAIATNATNIDINTIVIDENTIASDTNAADIAALGSGAIGSDPGDMQYWDGSVWVQIPAPVVDDDRSIPTLILCPEGVPRWSSTGCDDSYAIGDIGPGGGIVFYITDYGFHGLEVAPAGPNDFRVWREWGCEGTAIYGADGSDIGTGEQNTIDILNGCSVNDIAADIANSFVSSNGTYDWYLPSKDELNVLYTNRVEAGYTSTSKLWSSTEDNAQNAWYQDFFDGGQHNLMKSGWTVDGNTWGVVLRPIRTF